MQETIHKPDSSLEKLSTKAVLIANPTAGSYILHAHQIEHIVSTLEKQGWQTKLRLTQASGDARRIAKEAVAQHIDVVIAIGGDGTIHEVIQELAGSETALGVLPSGTINIWAREVGIPLDLPGAGEILLNGQNRQVDLGKVNDRYFLLMVGLGIDAKITNEVEKKPMKRLGVLGYLLMGAWWNARYSAFHATIELDKREIKVNALQIIIGNTQLYGGALKYTWQAKCDDGALDICVVRKQNFFWRGAIQLDFLLRRRQRHQWVRYETGDTIKIHTRQPISLQVDGEGIGMTEGEINPTTIQVVPQALKVIVPQTLPADLFSQPPL